MRYIVEKLKANKFDFEGVNGLNEDGKLGLRRSNSLLPN